MSKQFFTCSIWLRIEDEAGFNIKSINRYGAFARVHAVTFNPETNTLFVTGKYWDKLFEVEIIEK